MPDERRESAHDGSPYRISLSEYPSFPLEGYGVLVMGKEVMGKEVMK